ncbi:MAG: magnesium transporter [Acidobacteriota bacterium]|nr:magnesium transporter [Acidobacteriota bacterium]
MDRPLADERARMVRDRVRRLVRRGARGNLVRLLGKVRPEDVPILLNGLTESQQVFVFEVLLEGYPESAGEVISSMNPAERRLLLEALSPRQIAAALESLAVDDAAEIADLLADVDRDEVLRLMTASQKADVQQHLEYEEDTAGRIMNTELFSLVESTTVGEAIAAIQESADVEMIFYLYVVDDEEGLVGVTSLRQLLISPPVRRLSEMMTGSVIKVHTSTDQEEVAELAAHYDLLAIPVVDEDERLLGIVTVDDIIDVFQEEATEDLMKMAGTSGDELLYQERTWKVASIRLPWILANGVGLVVSGQLLRYFQVSLQEALFLLAFVPVIMGVGGNIGSQTSTIAVRGLATGRLGRREGRVRPFLLQQLRVGLVLGVICAVVAGIGAYLFESSLSYALVVGGALFLVIIVSSIIGAAAPIVFERMEIDPAVAASPLVTTTVDLTGILIYFGLAVFMIDWLVR